MSKPLPVLGSLFDQLNLTCPPLKIVDVGANGVDGDPPYKWLIDYGRAHLIGFEPLTSAFLRLQQTKGPYETYIPCAVGDGNKHTFYKCSAEGMSSLLPPNIPLLDMFHYFKGWCESTGTDEITTTRLEDVPETEGMDMLKIDVQGGEKMVFENAGSRLDTAVLVHTEVMFIPMYIGQPLYADLDIILRRHGFMLHRFQPLKHRTLRPVHPYGGFNQLVWGDAIFIRDITKLELMSDEQILRLAIILNDCYYSYDVVYYLLREYDRRTGTTYCDHYKEAVDFASIRVAFRHQPGTHDP